MTFFFYYTDIKCVVILEDQFKLKGKSYKRYEKLSLEESMKACKQAFDAAVKIGASREALEAAFKVGFEE